MTTINHPDLFPHLADYLDALTASEIRHQQRSAEHYASKGGTIDLARYETLFMRIVSKYAIDDHPRSKYIRVTANTGDQLFVHAFVDRATGSVYKPAGWKSPAKGKDGKPSERYNLLDAESRALLFERCEFTGGYLYADRAGAKR